VCLSARHWKSKVGEVGVKSPACEVNSFPEGRQLKKNLEAFTTECKSAPSWAKIIVKVYQEIQDRGTNLEEWSMPLLPNGFSIRGRDSVTEDGIQLLPNGSANQGRVANFSRPVCPPFVNALACGMAIHDQSRSMCTRHQLPVHSALPN